MDPADEVADILGRWREEAEHGRYIEPDSLLESHPEHAAALADGLEMQGLVDQYFAEEDALPFLTPERLGDYRIVQEIGRGGMGVVYEAEQESMQRRVALKVLYPTIATTVRTRKRFEREARLTGRLHHTNIVTVHAMGRQDGYFYFVMELVRGRPLDEVIGGMRTLRNGDELAETLEGTAAELSGRGSHERIARMAAEVADALQVAHGQGVIHRDVKPSNLVLDEEAVLKLTDFGLAHLVGEDLGVTRTGEAIGTPRYMSPEQVRARREDVDHRTDVYSLGATLYELLTLEPPHDGADIGTLCSQIIRDEPRALRQLDPSIPIDLATIVEKALQKEPADRYASAADMARDLRAFADRRPIDARRPTWMRKAVRVVRRHPVRSALVATIVLLAALGAWLHTESRAETERRIDAEYELLLVEAQEGRVRGRGHALEGGGAVLSVAADGDAVRGTLDRAIALRSDRFEAWFLRALLAPASVPLDESIADVERARTRGLPERTALLARAHLMLRGRRADLATELTERARRLPRGSTRDTFFEGDLLVRQGRWAEGVKLLSEVLAVTPATEGVHVMALMSRARAAEAAGEWSAAVTDLAAALHQRPGDGALGLRLAGAWRHLGQEKEAEEVLRETLQRLAAGSREADWLHLLFRAEGLVWADWRLRIHEAAHASVPSSGRITARYAVELAIQREHERALELASAAARSVAPRWRHRIDAHLARIHVEGGDHGKALRLWRSLLERHPDRLEYLVNAGCCQMRLGDLEGAEAFLRHAVGVQEHEPTAQANLADVLLRSGAPEEALPHAERAVHLARGAWGIRFVLAQVLQQLDRKADALAAVKRAMDLCRATKSARQLSVLSCRLGENGWHEQALTLLREALDLNADEPRIHHNLAVAYMTLGDHDQALVFTREAIKRDPDATDYHTLALLLSRRGEWLESLQACERAVDLDESLKPTLAKMLYNWGNWHYRGGRYRKAAEKYRAALAQDPSNVHAHANLGAMLYTIGDYEGAIAACRAALALDEAHANARGNLAHALHEQRKPREAIAEYEKVLEAHPGHAGARTGLAKSRTLLSLVKRTPRVLAGAEQPRNALDALYMADFILTGPPRRPRAALKLYRLAFQQDARLMNARSGSRYNAACAAVLSEEYETALTWLEADLIAWKAMLRTAPADAAYTLSHWQRDGDLKAVREGDDLGERATRLWREVARVLKQAQDATAK